ncbi:MAG: glutaredoxin 3 [Moraxellaceae bacterium]|jgi:glutaredoxin 3|nr:glutaredoxin 3 [Moraxellaceae bacterium]MBP8852774.1 glutaredoxin 3 [Moraxellaceae bacterium]MBP9045832.1 glutaredoxin 3 [Moraxellaceae bacterium]MBP9730503.1 glutaredoxin 3 [Moraxellaceae bacterium]MCC6200599.1 glutaredoxin 3 [Moraxellaceae bacterium]
MAEIIIYTTPICPYCVRAKQLLKQKGAEWTEVDVSRDANERMALMERTKQRTVPQIFINDQHVGGFDDLYALDRAGKLDAMLAS